MINLIPPEAEAAVKREYILRVGGTLSFLIGVVFLVLSIALIPTYVLVGAQINTSVRQTEEAGLSNEVARADNEVKMARRLLSQLGNRELAMLGSTAIEGVRAVAPMGISFRSFRVEETEGAITKVYVQGVATSRETLASFRTNVERSELFASAEVPISDLARDVNLPFNMTVIPRAVE